MDERNNSGVSATSPAYLGDLGGRLQREDADDLLKPADLDEHERVAEGAGGRRQAAEQQVPVTVVAKVRQARLVRGRRLGHHHHAGRVAASTAADPTAATTTGSTERPGLGRSGTDSGAAAGCWVYVATCNGRATLLNIHGIGDNPHFFTAQTCFYSRTNSVRTAHFVLNCTFKKPCTCHSLAKPSQSPNLHICITSSLFNLLAALALHLSSLSLGHERHCK